jgi:hypothetical protein
MKPLPTLTRHLMSRLKVATRHAAELQQQLREKDEELRRCRFQLEMAYGEIIRRRQREDA